MTALCVGKPAEWWSPEDPGARLAIAICRRCPNVFDCADGDPNPAGVIRGGVAYSDTGTPMAECPTCGYPRPARATGCSRCEMTARGELDPDEPEPDSGLVDEVAVERALAGHHLELTDAELVAVLQAGVARGIPLSQLSNRLGINYFGARKLLGGELTPRRAQQQRVEAELARIGHLHNDTTIAALVGVHHQTVTRARRRLAERQQQLAS